MHDSNWLILTRRLYDVKIVWNFPKNVQNDDQHTVTAHLTTFPMPKPSNTNENMDITEPKPGEIAPSDEELLLGNDEIPNTRTKTKSSAFGVEEDMDISPRKTPTKMASASSGNSTTVKKGTPVKGKRRLQMNGDQCKYFISNLISRNILFLSR